MQSLSLRANRLAGALPTTFSKLTALQYVLLLLLLVVVTLLIMVVSLIEQGLRCWRQRAEQCGLGVASCVRRPPVSTVRCAVPPLYFGAAPCCTVLFS
jgi:hypothetical protein